MLIYSLLAYSKFPATLVLCTVFFWQCYKSLVSWLDPEMVTVFSDEEIHTVLYPSVTICPMGIKVEQRTGGDNNTLTQIYDAMPKFQDIFASVVQKDKLNDHLE